MKPYVIFNKKKKHTSPIIPILIACIILVSAILIGGWGFPLIPTDEKANSTEIAKETYNVNNQELDDTEEYDERWDEVDSKENYITLENALNVSFIDVGQGNSTLIYNNEDAVLIDTGMYTNYESLATALSNAEITDLDCVILTHPDADHISACYELINDENFTVHSVMQLSNVTSDTDTYAMVQDAISNSGIEVISPKNGDIYNYCNANFEILGPVWEENVPYKESNDNSLVIKMTYDDASFLFAGDASNRTFDDIILSGGDLDVDIYQISHHGSANECNDEYLFSFITPLYSVISCQKGNEYGFPHKETMENLLKYNSKIFRTDLQGTVTVQTDGTQYVWDNKVCIDYSCGEDTY